MEVLSADGHIDLFYIPEDIFRNAAPPSLRERVPQMESPGCWSYEGNLLFKSVMQPPRSRVVDRMIGTGIFEQVGVRGASRPAEPHLRRADQLRDGIEGDVIYGLLGVDGYMINDIDAFRFCLLTYWQWVADFAKTIPGRFAPLAPISGGDPTQAAEDVHQIAELGLRGIELRPRTACKPFWHDDWEPLWRAVDKTGLPVHFHSDISRLMNAYTVKPDEANGTHYQKVMAAIVAATGKMANAESLGTMILSGVLERHPGMKVVMAECDLSWIPHFLERMDYCVTEREHGTGLPLLPSQYWRRQCLATFQHDKLGVELIPHLGADNVMWGNDYPHPDGVWPNSKTIIAEQSRGLTDEERQKVYFANCAKLYGLGELSAAATAGVAAE